MKEKERKRKILPKPTHTHTNTFLSQWISYFILYGICVFIQTLKLKASTIVEHFFGLRLKYHHRNHHHSKKMLLLFYRNGCLFEFFNLISVLEKQQQSSYTQVWGNNFGWAHNKKKHWRKKDNNSEFRFQ